MAATRKFNVSIDLALNQLTNAITQVLSSAPTGTAGLAYYNSTTGSAYDYDGVNARWVPRNARLETLIPLGALATIATATILGNNSGSTGVPLALTAAQTKTLLAIVPADISGFDTQVRTSTLNQMAAPTTDLAMASHKITGLADPTNAQDAATKTYVDSAVSTAAAGIDPKESVRAATTVNITLSGTQTIDGIALAVGNRVLVKNQTTASTNGIYLVAAGAWTRTADAAQGTLTSGALVFVEFGTTLAATQWFLQTADPITVGTTSLTWVQFGAGASYTAGNGLTLIGNAFAVGAGTGIVVSAGTTAIDTAVVARKFSSTIGDGSTLTYTVTHNLGTLDVHVMTRNVASGDIEECGLTAATTNTVTVTFAVAPATNTYRVTVIG